MSNTNYELNLTVNGERISRRISARVTLADFLRKELHLTGTHIGCEQGACGACTVRYNGDQVRACLMFAVQAEGAEVETIEGATETGELVALQEAFHRHNALQCGFCTPGMLLAAAELLKHTPNPDRAQIRAGLSGNYCRCTGYHAIVDAVAEVSSGNIEEVAE